MASQTEDFFENYAETLALHDAKALSKHHLLPCVFMLDDDKRIIHEPEEMIRLNKSYIEALEALNVVKHKALVNQAIRLSDNILFANVRWQFKDKDDKTVYSGQCSYTLQQVENDELKIIVEVIDDEDRILLWKMVGE